MFFANSSHRKKQQLSLAYQIIAKLKLDDLTYTHASIRCSDGFYIGAFGYLFNQITPQRIIKLDYNGNITEGKEKYNRTGFAIHGNCYKASENINAIIHVHTPEIIALSCLNQPLMPISQYYCMLHNTIEYMSYEGLILESKNDTSLAKAIKPSTKVVMLQAHGCLVFGSTIEEAMLKTIFLQKACQVQLMAMSTGKQPQLINKDVCDQTYKQMHEFETNLGSRDWRALVKSLKE